MFKSSMKITTKEAHTRCFGCRYFDDPMGYFTCELYKNYCEEIEFCFKKKRVVA